MSTAAAQRVEKRLRPEDGWWKNTEREWQELAQRLIDEGMDEEVALGILRDVHSLVREEYGD